MGRKRVIQNLVKHGSSGDQYLSSKQGGYVLDFYSVATGRHVSFKGFITEFNDSFQASYNSESVYGRMDPIMTYQGTQRTINASFDVVAVNMEESVSNLARIENLVTLLYPKYNSSENGQGIETIQATPLIKVKFANMILDASSVEPVGRLFIDNDGREVGSAGSISAKNTGLLGAIEGFEYQPNFDQGMFMTNNGKAFPKYVALSFSMTVLHTHKLGWDDDNKWRGDRPGATNGMGYPYGTHDLSNDPTVTDSNRDSVGNFVNANDPRFDAQKNSIKVKILGG